MSSFYYYTSTIIYFGLILVGSCFIPSVDVIFEFAGVICVNCMSFLFPSFFYLHASKRYHASREQTLQSFTKTEGHPIQRNLLLEFCAWFQIGLGVVAFVAGMFNNIHGLINDE
jgi:hypothetical protein